LLTTADNTGTTAGLINPANGGTSSVLHMGGARAMNKSIFNFVIIVFLLVLLCVSSSADINKEQYLVNLSDNSPQLFVQPNGPFEVMFFNHYAQGNYIGVIYYKLDFNGTVDAPWKFSKCFWQEESWCSDVTNFAWSVDGKYLYVSTSEVYGSGRLWELDLYNKKSRPIFPNEDEIKSLKSWKGRDYSRTYIIDIDISKNTIKVIAETDKEKIVKEIKML
jgi:hypothetical protein